MREGDADTNYAYYCFHKKNMLPSQYIALDRREKATIIAFIQIKTENDKNKAKEIERKARK